jgi:hypothetical protein
LYAAGSESAQPTKPAAATVINPAIARLTIVVFIISPVFSRSLFRKTQLMCPENNPESELLTPSGHPLLFPDSENFADGEASSKEDPFARQEDEESERHASRPIRAT